MARTFRPRPWGADQGSRFQQRAFCDDTPAYDVATIKPNNSGSGKSDAWTHDNAYVTRNFGLKPMLQDAFDVQQNLIYGLPAWAVSARFDVEAKVTEMTLEQLRSLTPQQHRGMLQALLADRFGLKWHMATQTVPVYELDLTKDGPKFKVASGADAEGPGDGTHVRRSELGIRNVALSEFCDVLSDRVQRPVVNKTGLSGKYTFMVRFTPDQEAAKVNGETAPNAEALPTLFTALQEQLGLKLQAGKAPVQTLVIDQISPPTEN